jgi:transcriptional regulator with XRE-family HTH domain
MCSGETLKKLRLLKGLNQKGIAQKLGVTQQAYSKMEKLEKIEDEKISYILKKLNWASIEIDEIKMMKIKGGQFYGLSYPLAY